MRRILFVDDEPNVLQGLRRMLRPMRHEWDMEFASSGPEALARMAEVPVDIIVSDMRMPGMDGAELLNQVMQQHPQTVRIVLSGQSDRETILRSVGPTHQFLSKPCDAETVHATVVRACALRDVLHHERLQGIISQIDSLPSLPDLYVKVVEAIDRPEASMAEVGRLISQDLGMSAKILQLVNSAFFGVRRRIASPEQAVNLLGLNTVRALVLQAQVFRQYSDAQLRGFSLEALEQHSVRIGTIARRIASDLQFGQSRGEDAFMAGLLHDVGKLILAANLPEEYREVMARRDEQGVGWTSAEFEVFGCTHAEVGGYLLGLWGLSDPIVEAVAFHHRPGDCGSDELTVLTTVHLADGLDGLQNDETRDDADPFDREHLAALGLDDRLSDWCEATAATAGEVS